MISRLDQIVVSDHWKLLMKLLNVQWLGKSPAGVVAIAAIELRAVIPPQSCLISEFVWDSHAEFESSHTTCRQRSEKAARVCPQ